MKINEVKDIQTTKNLYLMKILTKNIQFYEYLGMGMGIDTQFLGYLVRVGYPGILSI